MHGGKSPGAPKGNANAFKHGRYTTEHVQTMRLCRELAREAKDLIEAIE